MDALGGFLCIMIFVALLCPHWLGEWLGKVAKAFRDEVEGQ